MNDYSNIIKDYVKKMKKELKEELSLLFIIGSGSSNKVIAGWSDIDSIVVIKSYKDEVIKKIINITNSFSVKIGVTIYSDSEFINIKFDQKTYYYLYLTQESEIKIQYKRKDFVIPKINFDDVKKQYIANFYSRLHLVKRFFFYKDYELDKEKIRTLYKNTYLIMKDVLVIKGYRPKNYEDVFQGYSNVFEFEYYDYEMFIKNYIDNNKKYLDIIDYAKKVLLHIIGDISL